MMLHIFDNEVKCPREDKKKIEISNCRKNCKYFKGYKAVYDHRMLLCEYYYKRSQK